MRYFVPTPCDAPLRDAGALEGEPLAPLAAER
jgi:hypothetical protein